MKNTQISNLIKIRPLGAEFHAVGRKNMMRQMVAFRSFAKPPTNCSETPFWDWKRQLPSNTDRLVAKLQ
jgi:hypothetical protein